jgi:energy-converting hydrogenase Eha subunit A
VAEKKKHEPPIVAELGRPETADEAAARKAETTRRHRASQTVVNLVMAVVASLAVVLVLVLVVVRPEQPAREPVDYEVVAEQAQVNADVPLATPAVPADWRANDARLETVSGVQTWYIGFITGEAEFIALNQGIDSNPTWQSTILRGGTSTGAQTIAGLEWKTFDHRDEEDKGNLAFAMATTVDGTDYVLFGTASDAEFELLASSIGEELE